MNEQWVPYKLKTGKILYHINAVTGECRWTNQLKKVQTNIRPQRRLDKICSMWNVKRLRWRDIKTQTAKEDEDKNKEGSSSQESFRNEVSDDDKDKSKSYGSSTDTSTNVQNHGLSIETDTPMQSGSECHTCGSNDSSSFFHTLIQQVLDNQHTIYEKLQQIEGQMSRYNTSLMAQPSQPSKSRGGSSAFSGVSRMHGKQASAPTIVLPEGTNVFMQSGATNTEPKMVEKKQAVEKTIKKKIPNKKLTPHTPDLDQETLDELKKQANSQVNFSVKLLKRVTTVEERIGKAVYGNRNKGPLDPEVVRKIKKYYFHVYPSRNKELEWGKCVTAMNLHLRKMKK